MTLTALKAGAYLHHIHLHSPDPERLATFYGEAMDMSVERHGDFEWLCAGPRRRVVVSRGEAKKLAHGAFACRDREGLEDIRGRAHSEGLDPQSFTSPLFAQDAFAVADPDGNVVVFGLAVEEPAHQPGMRGPIQHLTL